MDDCMSGWHKLSNLRQKLRDRCEMLNIVLLLFACVAARCSATDYLEEVFAWKKLSFAWPNQGAKAEAIKCGDYIPANNVPKGVQRWKDKVFVSIPRVRKGVAATLNYVRLDSKGKGKKSPTLIPYPSWEANTLPTGDKKLAKNAVVSTFRTRVDQCDRLWAIDDGIVDILGSPKRVAPPAIVIFDLKTDKLIRRYSMKKSDFRGRRSTFVEILVDVTAKECNKAFAYCSDTSRYGLVVYSFEKDESWRITHNFLYFNPVKGDLNVGGVNYQRAHGVFGLALDPRDKSGYGKMYFNGYSSTDQFSVSTEVLRNKTLALDSRNYHLFKYEGWKGPKTQTASCDFDEKTSVLFIPQISKDGIAYWNTKKPLKPKNVHLFVQDHDRLIFPNDLKIDQERNIWVLSNKFPVSVYGQLDFSKVNFRIFNAPVDKVIKLKCEV